MTNIPAFLPRRGKTIGIDLNHPPMGCCDDGFQVRPNAHSRKQSHQQLVQLAFAKFKKLGNL